MRDKISLKRIAAMQPHSLRRTLARPEFRSATHTTDLVATMSAEEPAGGAKPGDPAVVAAG